MRSRLLAALCALALVGLAPTARAAGPPAGLASYRELALPNGLRVLLGAPRRPAIFSEVLLVVRGGGGPPGSRQEELAQVAAAALTAGRLPEGPPARVQLARLGVALDSTAGRDVAVFRFTAPTRSTLPLLRLLADLLARETLPESVWAEAIARRAAERVPEQAEPWRRASATLTDLTWRQAPAGAAPLPLAAAPLAPREVADFRAGAYVPGRMVLSVWGSLPDDEVAAAVRRELGRLPPVLAAAAATAPAEPVKAAGGETRCLEDAGAVVPGLLVGVGVEAESDLAFYAWQVAAHVLGAHYNSRLQSRLRTESGLAYSVEADCVPAGSRGLTLRVAAQAEQVEATRRIVLEELRRLAREPVTQSELDVARAILRSRLALDHASFRDRFYRRSLALLGVPGRGDPAAAEPLLAGLTPAGLLAVLRRTLRPEAAATVVVASRTEPICE